MLVISDIFVIRLLIGVINQLIPSIFTDLYSAA